MNNFMKWFFNQRNHFADENATVLKLVNIHLDLFLL